MKRYITAFLSVLLCAVIICPAASAYNRVPDMEIEVVLQSDGSAHITQIWSTDTNEGTEFYLARRDSGYLTITDFSVSDQNGTYTFVEDWDVDASFEEKVGKCGILETDEGVELCWGISEYGENRYVIEYVLHGLVGSYSDADGFNHRFVDDMSFFPTDVLLTIRNQSGTPLNDDLCDIWAFGYDGQIVFEDGAIYAWSEEPLERGQHMTVMVALEKGVLSPVRSVDDSFETVKERAFDGSDYEDDVTLFDIINFALFFAVVIGLMILPFVIYAKIQKAKLNKRMKNAQYFRDAPNDGNLNVSYRLGRCSNLSEEDALVGTYLLRLVAQGCLESVEDAPDAEKVKLRLCHEPQSGNEYDDALYTILEAAAGTDGVLQPKEFEQFCSQNNIPIFRFVDSCEKNAMQTLIRGGCLKGAQCDNIKSLTQAGQRELDELLGLKHFLLDFSLIQERGVKEAVIWQDYMVYALLLGIADQLAAQIRDLYPESVPHVEQYQRYISYTGYYRQLIYNAYRNEQLRLVAARNRGSGGRASRGGGGGFSGGGRGGTR